MENNYVFHHIKKRNPELISCMSLLANELSNTLKKSKKAAVDDKLKDVMNCLREPREDKHKTILDFEIEKDKKEADSPMKTNVKSSFQLNNFEAEVEQTIVDLKPKINTNIEVYDRNVKSSLQKEKKVEIMKNKIRVQEKEKFKPKPQLSKGSEKIIKTKEFKPLFNRVSEVLSRKNENMERIQKNYEKFKQIEEEESVGFFKIPGKFENQKFQDWNKGNFEWNQNKKEKIIKMKQEAEYVESENTKLMHHPKIDRNSEYIIRHRNNSSLNVYEKLFKYSFEKSLKLKKIRNNSLPSFSPSINNKNFKNLQQNGRNSSNLIYKNNSIVKTQSKLLNFSMENLNNKQGKNTLFNSNLDISRNKNSFYNSSIIHKDNSIIHKDNNDSDVSNFFQKSERSEIIIKKPVVNKQFNSVTSRYKNDTPWQNKILFKSKPDIISDHHCKLFIRNNSAWDNRQNKVILNKKISNVLRKPGVIKS